MVADGEFPAVEQRAMGRQLTGARCHGPVCIPVAETRYRPRSGMLSAAEREVDGRSEDSRESGLLLFPPNFGTKRKEDRGPGPGVRDESSPERLS